MATLLRLCNWNQGPRLRPLHLVLSQESRICCGRHSAGNAGAAGASGVSARPVLGRGSSLGEVSGERPDSHRFGPRSHTRLIPSLPNSDVVFSLWLFSNPTLAPRGPAVFSAGVVGWGGQERSYSHQISSVATEWRPRVAEALCSTSDGFIQSS